MRIIGRLDIKNSNLIKGVNLEGLRRLGNPNDFALKYYMKPYGYWTKIGWSHGYGVNCACAYADLSKIKPSGKRFEYIAIVKNKLDDQVLIKVRTDSKEQAIEEAMKKCTEKNKNGCYVHYSSQVAFGQ